MGGYTQCRETQQDEKEIREGQAKRRKTSSMI